MRTILLTSFFLALSLSAWAQPADLPSYAQIAAAKPEVEATTVTGPAPVFAHPTPDSDFLGRLANGDSVLVHDVAQLEEGLFVMYGIATLEKGFLGYIHPHYLPQEMQDRMKKREVTTYPDPSDLPTQAAGLPGKNPRRATLLSALVAGGGHLYAGETQTGLFLLLSSATTLGIGAGLMVYGDEADCSGFDCLNRPQYSFLVIGGLYYLGAWLYGVNDAANAARRQNVLREFADLGPVDLSPTVATHGGDDAYGLSASISF